MTIGPDMKWSSSLAAMVIMGVTFIIAQILVVREFLIVFQGNELSIGIVLGNWLLLEAMGSRLGGWRADRSRAPVKVCVLLQTALSLLLPLTILCIRMGRTLACVPPWETIGPIRMWMASLVVLGPVGISLGAEFSFGCRVLFPLLKQKSRTAGTVYILEAIGSVCGGIIFTYLLVGHLHAVKTALVIGGLNAVSALSLVRDSRRLTAHVSVGSGHNEDASQWSRSGLKTLHTLCLSILFAVAILWFTPLADLLDQWSSRMRWKTLTLVESADSVYGNISVFKLGEQTSFFQNGVPAITAPIPDITSVEELVHLSLLSHGHPVDVLFLGGGLGGALAEALKHPISHLYYTELDPLVIRMVQRYPSPLTEHELGDPRTLVRYEDGRLFLLRTGLSFDAVLVNLPDATTLLINRFFTAEFFALLGSHLNPGGLIALTLPGSTSYLGEEMLLLNRCVLQSLRQIFPHTRIIPGERNLVLASRDIPLDTLTPEVLANRMAQSRINAAVVSPYHIKLKMDPVRARWLGEELDKVRHARINQDFSPRLLYYFLAYRNAQLHTRWRHAVLALDSIRTGHVLAGLAALNIPILIWFLAQRRARSMALSFAIFTTGFAGMTLEIVLILAFQTLYGYIYHWMGILVSSFMGGLALGAFLVNRRMQRWKRGHTIFLLLETLILIVLVTLSLVAFIPSRMSMEGPLALGLLKAVFVVVSSISGFLVGTEFPLANQEALRYQRGFSGIAGRLYALDLAGAWVGTTLVSVFFVPLIGIPQTLLLAGALKAFGLLYLVLARQ